MPLQVDGTRIQVLGPVTSINAIGYQRRTRQLSDIAPQYVAKSGLCSASELESSRGGSIRIQHVTGLTNTSQGKSRFPKLDECAHFHYEHVELGPLQLSLIDDEDLKPLGNETDQEKWWSISVTSQSKTWLIRRSYGNFRMLDQQLHRCIFDRKFSELPELPIECIEEQENIHKLLQNYLERLSGIAVNVINCGPVLNWLELDNRGYRLLVPDTDNCPINTPAVAAAYSIKRYIAQAPDEISFEVGDMISVIDMPPPKESIWWRGKKGFQVGFFPCECVAIIGDKVPRDLQFCPPTPQPTKPVLRKHGKLIAFFRSFILSRPSRRRLKQSGILKERVFGCDLGEHLLNSGHEIPVVLKCCVEFIETNGLIDGIYRLSGVTSNIQKLRNAFDEDRIPSLYEDEAILQDVHSVASLLKMYFRELPNPLCTYQLYHQFVEAVQAVEGDDTRLIKMRDVVQKLPPPHYRTLEYLMRHLCRVSEKGHETGMTPRNVAIVWAPNLLRCKELEVGGVAALQGVGVQAVVTEFLVCYADLIFCDKLPSSSLPPHHVNTKKCRPKSLTISTPTKLLSLEEARMRALNQGKECEYIEVGDGPANIPAKYHTVIELPGCTRKRMGSKRSPIGWKMFFGKSGRGSQSRKEVEAKASATSDLGISGAKLLTESESTQIRRCLRAAKSAESLSSTRSSSALVVAENLKTGFCRVEDSLGPLIIRNNEGKSSGHNRSVSHESYFDQLQDKKEEIALDISEIQVNFDLEESEMRIFSEDETLMSNGSGSLVSINSPRILGSQKSGKIAGNSVKRLSNPKLASSEDRFNCSQSADPSPKKLKTSDGGPPRSKLEEQLSSSVGDIQFIDSVSPDQGVTQCENELIQSPSPVSSISQISSSLMTPSSPILPHIPHLSQSLPQSTAQKSSNDAFVSLNKFNVDDTDKSSDLMEILLVAPSSQLQSTVITESSSHSHLGSPSLVEATISDSESFSLQSSEFTTPETPVCSIYTPLIDIEESNTSNMTTPDFDSDIRNKKYCSETSGLDIPKSNSENEKRHSNEEKSEKYDLKIASYLESFEAKPIFENIDLNLVKIQKLNTKEDITPPKPEERKPKPVHPYVNIPVPIPDIESPKIFETVFDETKLTFPKRETVCNIGYKCISTESSSDSIDSNKGDNYFDHPLISKSFYPNSSSVLSDNFSKEGEECRQCDSAAMPFVEDLSCNFNKEESEMNLLTECTNWLFENQQFSKSCFLDSHQMNNEPDANAPLAIDQKDFEKSPIFPFKNESLSIGGMTEDPNVKSVMETEKFIKAESDSFIVKDLKLCDTKSKTSFTKNFFFKEDTIRESNELVEKNYNSVSPDLLNERILETDLDASLDNLIDLEASSKNKRIEEKPVPKKRNQAIKSNSIPNIQNEIDKSEINIERKINAEESEHKYQNKILKNDICKSDEFEKEMIKISPTCNEERPKTLERLFTKRKTEKEAHKSMQIRLEKSKSGSQIDEERSKNEKVDFLFNCELDLSDPQRRERIEKYKEKRRNYLREKYRSDSFKSEKDDIVAKIKQKHFRKIDLEEIPIRERRLDTSSEKSGAGSNKSEKFSEKKGNKGTTLKFSPSKIPKPEIFEKSRFEKATTSSSLKENSSKRFNFKRVNSESSSANDFKSSKNSFEKKNAFSESSLEKQSPDFKGSRTQRRMTEFSRPISFSGSSSSSSTTRGDLEKENSPNKIKDVAALFERRKDSKPAKQYLSSV